MGKNNRKDFNKKSNSPIYDEDLNKKFLGHTQNKAKDTSYTKSEPRKKERPFVEPDDVMKQLIDMITAQVGTFVKEQKSGLNDMTSDERIQHENNLYRFDYPMLVDDIEFYLVDRSVRTDRQTHTLSRSTCALVGIKDGKPAYYMSTYLTQKLMGNITLFKFNENGPIFRGAVRVDIVNSDLVEDADK